jgi:hypothetical protein
MKLKEFLEKASKGKKINIAKKLGETEVVLREDFNVINISNVRFMNGKIVIYPEKRYFERG